MSRPKLENLESNGHFKGLSRQEKPVTVSIECDFGSPTVMTVERGLQVALGRLDATRRGDRVDLGVPAPKIKV